jgi:hypothetical protein
MAMTLSKALFCESEDFLAYENLGSFDRVTTVLVCCFLLGDVAFRGVGLSGAGLVVLVSLLQESYHYSGAFIFL